MAKYAYIVRLADSSNWMQVANPYWYEPSVESFASLMLEQNSFIEYVEWANTGSIYRVVRTAQLSQYIKKGDRNG